MKTFSYKLGTIFANLVFAIGFFVSQGVCCGLFYQPDMPTELTKKFA